LKELGNGELPAGEQVGHGERIVHAFPEACSGRQKNANSELFRINHPDREASGFEEKLDLESG
jgi:hypothetical protein